MQADAVTALDALTGALGVRGIEAEGFHTPEVHSRLTAPLINPAEFRSEPGGLLDPREAISVLDAELPGEIGLVLGSGHPTDFGTMLFQRSREITSNYGMFGGVGRAPLLTMYSAPSSPTAASRPSWSKATRVS